MRSSKPDLVLCLLALALPASAQLDSAQLRVKFGTPLNREIFRVPPGFDLVVDYGAGNQVCKLQVPALMPTDAKVQNAYDMKQKMYSFLAELVPDSMRGKRGVMSLFSTVSVEEYEHVEIAQTNDTISVRFKDAGCQPTDQIAR